MSGDNQLLSINPTPARPWPILAAALGLGLLFNYFLFGNVPGLGYPLFVISIISAAVWLSRRFARPLSRAGSWFAILSVIFACMVAVRASHELTFMNIVLSLFLLMLVVSELVGKPIRTFFLERYGTLGWLPLHFAGNILLFFAAWFQDRQSDKKNDASRSILRGLLMALPVLFVFVLLFSSADLVFQKYVKSIVNFNVSMETLVRIFFVIAVSLGFCGAFWYVFGKKHELKVANTEASRKASSIGRTEIQIFLGSVSLLFLLFIIIQLNYLFGGEQSIIKQGFTYAEYARRGFFELMVVAAISWLMVWTLDRAIAHNDANVQKLSKTLSTALTLEVFVIMASAFMRLGLYEQAYGFTTMRFYSHVLVIWLGVIFLALLYKLFRSRREDSLAFSILLSVLVFAVGINIFNPDAFIAKENLDRFKTSGKLDVFYLDQLSFDAIPAMMPLLDQPETEAAKALANRIYWKQQQLDNTARAWQSQNLGRNKARHLLDGKKDLLKQYENYSLDTFQGQQSTAD